MEPGAHADPFRPHTTHDDHRHSRYKNTSPIAPMANAINTGRRMMEILDANIFIRSTLVLSAARARARNASPSCVGLSSLLLCTMLRSATFSIEYDLLALLCALCCAGYVRRQENGIRNIVALRGDPPAGTETWEATEGGFACALDLVST